MRSHERLVSTALTAVLDVLAFMSAQYQAVPTDPHEDEGSPKPQAPKSKYYTAYFLKLVLFTGAFCLVAAFSFKAGQWSVHIPANPQSTALVEDIQEEVQDSNDTSIAPPAALNDTEVDYSHMPGNGKYSVG